MIFADVIPDGDEARRWAEEELSKPAYVEATPTAFDLWARDVARFLMDLLSGDGGGDLGPWGLVIVGVIVLGLLIAALRFWGAPRRARRVRRGAGDLLGSRDDRSTAQLRADAERSARGGAWAEATILRYRAIARALIERDLLDPAPGATAQALAREACASFPDERSALLHAAGLFDEVRYLDHAGTAEGYRDLTGLDERLMSKAPEAVPA